MTLFPDRLSALARRIEAGDTITQADVDRVAMLQAFDVASMGRQFVEAAGLCEKKADDEIFKQLAER